MVERPADVQRYNDEQDVAMPEVLDGPLVGGARDDAEYEALLARMGPRDRQAVERHVAVCEGEADSAHAVLWKRLACLLGELAPKAVQTAGQKAVQFFVADGKYRRQTFALEDPRDGTVVVYAADVVKAAIEAGVLRGPLGKGAEASVYEACQEGPGVTVDIQSLTAANSAGAPDYYRHMVGWGRAVSKVTLPTSASAGQLRVVKALCAMAARQVGGGA